MHTTVAVIVLTVIVSTTIGIIVQVKHFNNQITKIVNGMVIALQTIWGAILGLRLGTIGGVDAIISLEGHAEGPNFIGVCIGGPVGLIVGGTVGVIIGIICVRISAVIVDWMTVDTV